VIFPFVITDYYIKVGGYKCICEKEFPVELRNAEEPDETHGAVLLFKMKVVVITDKDEVVQSLRVDLTNEDDIFFYYRHTSDAESFREIAARYEYLRNMFTL
jgi:hypothetical protein